MTGQHLLALTILLSIMALIGMVLWICHMASGGDQHHEYCRCLDCTPRKPINRRSK